MKQTNSIIRVLCSILIVVLTVAFVGCGEVKFDPNKNISVTAREDGSGTKAAFMELLGLKGKADVSGVIVASSTPAVLTEVKSNPYAIGYESLGFVTDEVKMLKVDGVEATVENIKSGEYKISRPLNIVYKEATLDNDLQKAFYEFLHSVTAQEIISDKGYVATNDAATTYSIHSGISGTITLSGSTSLQPLMIVLAEKFESLQNGVTVTVQGGGSGTGYKDAENGVSDFGMISEVFNATKAESCVSYEVAKDGIAIIVNLKNTYDNVALDDLKAIYDCDAGDNAIKTWVGLAA